MKSYQWSVEAAKQPARYLGGPFTQKPTMIVMHATAGDYADGAMSWLNRLIQNAEAKASYHYIVDRKDERGGKDRIVRFVSQMHVAYHAGASWWPTPPKRVGVTRHWQSVNRFSFGVAFANDNGADGDERDDVLTDFQLKAGLWLCVTLCRLHRIPAERVLAHREVSPGRKTDPLARILDMDDWRRRIAAELAV